jgi:hypothetical protein
MAVLVERILAAAAADVRFGHAVVAIDTKIPITSRSLSNRAQIASELCILALAIRRRLPSGHRTCRAKQPKCVERDQYGRHRA